MNRLEALRKVLGLQDATMEQIAEATGCKVEDLNNPPPIPDKSMLSPYMSGGSAARTCSLEHNRAKVFPQHQGDVAFWIGAADGLIVLEKMGPLVIRHLRSPS